MGRWGGGGLACSSSCLSLKPGIAQNIALDTEPAAKKSAFLSCLPGPFNFIFSLNLILSIRCHVVTVSGTFACDMVDFVS